MSGCKKDKIKDNLILFFVPFAIVGCVFLLFFMWQGYAPFGERSLAYFDANSQYLGFFSYYKDVLTGKNDILYTFSKDMGSSALVVFSYYLSSPFQLLTIFFSKENLITCFHLIVVLKIALSATTCSFFLQDATEGRLGDVERTLIAVSYALCEYNITQIENVMWLDGVYMLPLILTGINRIVRNKKGVAFLAGSVAAGMLFNWYTGVMNCLFSVVWLVLIYLLFGEKRTFRKTGGRYVVGMILGIMISAALFLPTMILLLKNGGGASSLLGEEGWGFIVSPLTFFRDYYIGSSNFAFVGLNDLQLSLYAGFFVLLGAGSLFLSRSIQRRDKIILGVGLVVVLLLYAWNPCFRLYSMFQDINGYWSRYSYIGSLFLVFLAGYAYAGQERRRTGIYLATAVGYALCFLLTYEEGLNRTRELMVLSIAICFLEAVVLTIWRGGTKNRTLSGVFGCVLIVLSGSELLYEMYHLTDYFHMENVSTYRENTIENAESIQALKEWDDGVYRMTVIPDTVDDEKNQSMTYNFWSLCSYTSNSVANQKEFLAKAGYRTEGQNQSIYGTSLLGIDSLLGVKYLYSSQQMTGLCPLEGALYENPYAFPMAFVTEATDMQPSSASQEDPFIYQNELYRNLLGIQEELYETVDYQEKKTTEGAKKQVRTYELQVPKGDFILYGRMPWDDVVSAKLSVNGEEAVSYADVGGSDVFYIPISEEDGVARIVLSGNLSGIEEPSFYALNLQVFAQAHALVQSQMPGQLQIENGYARIQVNAEEGEMLFTSIPWDDGWRITVNDKVVEPTCIEGVLQLIPLESGSNDIEMKYQVPGAVLGLWISMIGLIGMVIIAYEERKRKS